MSASESGERKGISDRTNVQLGLVIASVAVLAGAMWWAATINAKVDSILVVLQEIASMRAKSEDLERRVWKLEQEKKP